MLLIGENIQIRDFKEGDFTQFLALVSDKSNHELAGLKYSTDSEYVHQLFKLYCERGDANVIAKRDDDQMIGIMEINHRGEYENLAMTREIGFVVDQSYRKKGFATEAIKLVVDYSFQQLHLEELWASTEVNNQAPQTILEKLGFKYIYSADQALPFAEQSNVVKYYLLKK